MGYVIAGLVASSALALPMSAQADVRYPCAATPAAITPGTTVTFSCADGTFSPFESVLVIVEGDADAIGPPDFEVPSTRATFSTGSGAVAVSISFPTAASGSYDIAAASATSAAGSTVSVSRSADAPPGLGRSGLLVGIWWCGGRFVLAGAAIAVETSVRRNRRHHERTTQ